MTLNKIDSKQKLNIKTAVLIVLFFISLILTIWAIDIYRMTIIEMKYLYAVAALGAITVVLILYRYKTIYSRFWTFFISIVIGGGFFYFGLLYLNQAFADKETLTEDFQIIETGTLARGRKNRCSKPFAVINFNGSQKDLIFYCEYEKTIKNFSKVSLTYSRGLLGFTVIKSKRLIE